MKFEVTDNVTQLLSGEISPGPNFVVRFKHLHNVLEEVASADMTAAVLRNMLTQALEVDPQGTFSVEVVPVSEHLYGTAIRSKISLDDLEAEGEATRTIAIRVFGERLPSAGYTMHYTKVTVYKLLVVLAQSFAYKKIEVIYN